MDVASLCIFMLDSLTKHARSFQLEGKYSSEYNRRNVKSKDVLYPGLRSASILRTRYQG